MTPSGHQTALRVTDRTRQDRRGEAEWLEIGWGRSGTGCSVRKKAGWSGTGWVVRDKLSCQEKAECLVVRNRLVVRDRLDF